MTEQKAHTLPVMRPPTRLCKRGANINSLKPLPTLLLLLMRYRIRHYQLAQRALLERLNRIPRQDAVRDNGNHFLSVMSHERVDSFHQRAAGIGHIVYEDGSLAFDVADEDHAADFVGARALFVDQGEAEVEAVCDRGCPVEMIRYHALTNRGSILQTFSLLQHRD